MGSNLGAQRHLGGEVSAYGLGGDPGVLGSHPAWDSLLRGKPASALSLAVQKSFQNPATAGKPVGCDSTSSHSLSPMLPSGQVAAGGGPVWPAQREAATGVCSLLPSLKQAGGCGGLPEGPQGALTEALCPEDSFGGTFSYHASYLGPMEAQ